MLGVAEETLVMAAARRRRYKAASPVATVMLASDELP